MSTNNQVNVGLSGSSGSGSFAGTTSPSFTTPVLGTPTSGNLSNCTSIPVAQATGLLPLANGGLNANLTASNGGIFYSNASAGAILAGTATAGQIIRSGASTAPTWSTSTYPDTNAINTLLYASSANVMAALATANNGILVTSSGGVPSIGNTVGAGLTMPSVTFNTTSGIIGSTTNDAAAAGSVGQLISSVIATASATSLTTNIVKDVTSISLTAGDWDVWGNVTFLPAATTVIVSLSGWASSTSATQPDGSLYAQNQYPTGFAPNVSYIGFTGPQLRFSLSGTTTIYLSALAGFATSTLTVCGGIYARRRR